MRFLFATPLLNIYKTAQFAIETEFPQVLHSLSIIHPVICNLGMVNWACIPIKRSVAFFESRQENVAQKYVALIQCKWIHGIYRDFIFSLV